MALYQLTLTSAIKRITDDAIIPNDPANCDYQVYLVWAAAGNTPDPAPSVPAKPQQITSTQFLNRIPPAALPVLWSNPSTGVLLITLAAAGTIDLTDPSVQAGVNALVPSVLTVDQAAAILDH